MLAPPQAWGGEGLICPGRCARERPARTQNRIHLGQPPERANVPAVNTGGELGDGSINAVANLFPAKILADKSGNGFSNVVMASARDYHNNLPATPPTNQVTVPLTNAPIYYRLKF